MIMYLVTILVHFFIVICQMWWYWVWECLILDKVFKHCYLSVIFSMVLFPI